MKRKTSSTIPFGYKQSESMEGFMEPVPEQLSALEEAKGHIINGALSLRGAAEQLQYRTGPVSYTHLTLPTKRIV